METNKKAMLLTLLAAVAFTLALFTGCKKDSSTGQLRIMMTDAPAAYSAVYVDVIGIEVHSDVSGWVTPNDVRAGIYNLLDLTNGTDTLIATANLPAGSISQIRLILGDNNSVVANGTVYDMKVPSGSESGLKINLHTDIQESATTEVLLDFDAAGSVVAQGNGDYHLKPVIRSIVREATGSISGQLSSAVLANVYVVSGNDTIRSSVDANGRFVLQGIYPGTYDLVIEPAIFNKIVLHNITVTANHTTSVGLVAL